MCQGTILRSAGVVSGAARGHYIRIGLPPVTHSSAPSRLEPAAQQHNYKGSSTENDALRAAGRPQSSGCDVNQKAEWWQVVVVLIEDPKVAYGFCSFSGPSGASSSLESSSAASGSIGKISSSGIFEGSPPVDRIAQCQIDHLRGF